MRRLPRRHPGHLTDARGCRNVFYFCHCGIERVDFLKRGRATVGRFRFSSVAAATAIALALSGVVAAHGAAATPATPSARFMVQFSPGARAQGMGSLKQEGAKVALNVSHSPIVAVTMPTGSVNSLRSRPGIGSVEPDPVRHLMSDQIDPNAQITPYGVTMTQADQVNPADPSNKTVCIIDSGYFLGHEDLPTANVTGTSESPDSPWNQDGLGHGSHVAGIVAAVNNGRGVVGADPGVNLHIVRVLDNDGNFFASSLINVLGSCESAGANVVNMSLGGSDRSGSNRMPSPTPTRPGFSGSRQRETTGIQPRATPPATTPSSQSQRWTATPTMPTSPR